MDQEIRLLIATHSYGTVMPAYAVSLARLTGQLAKLGLRHAVMMVEDSLVDRGRDRAAAEFRAGGFTHLLFIDGDVEFQAEAVLALLEAKKPVIGGALPRKAPVNEFIVTFLPGPIEQCPESKAVKVARLGAGFLLIAREVFDRFEAAYPDIRYIERSPSGERQMSAFFEHVVRDGVRLSEDYSFCDRWRAIGGDIWLCPFLEFNHWGSTFWKGSVLSKFRPGDAG